MLARYVAQQRERERARESERAREQQSLVMDFLAWRGNTV
jgi:hypothetical protein